MIKLPKGAYGTDDAEERERENFLKGFWGEEEYNRRYSPKERTEEQKKGILPQPGLPNLPDSGLSWDGNGRNGSSAVKPGPGSGSAGISRVPNQGIIEGENDSRSGPYTSGRPEAAPLPNYVPGTSKLVHAVGAPNKPSQLEMLSYTPASASASGRILGPPPCPLPS